MDWELKRSVCYETDSSMVYDNYIESCIRKIQKELSRGDIQSTAGLQEIVREVVKFHDSVEAYKFFNSYAPYDWEKHMTASIIERFKFDLDSIVLAVVNTVIFSDVYEEVEKLPCYKFLNGEKKRRSILLKTGEKVIFEEYWKSEEDYFTPITILPNKFEGKELKIFKQGLDSPLCYILEHSDASLVWIGKTVISAPLQSVEFFKENKIDMLRKHGCPAYEILNIKIQTISEFEEIGNQFSFNPVEDFDLFDSHYVLSHLDNGILNTVSGFSDEAGFDKACETVSEYLMSCELA